ncbi:MAG: hypothetical protein JXM70_06675 [Pirellulales bacterium]|nr:hypothetical protein [Pirellulales bacterium]
MDVFSPSTVIWIVIGVQMLGLFGALLSRLGEGSPGEGRCQCFFLFCLALVGTTTIAAMSLDPGAWLTCGATLSIMVLIALYDCGTAKEIAV